MDIIEAEKKREFEAVLPLVNIVFLLLIFFMLAGAFTQPDIFKVQLPEAASGANANREDITLLLNHRGELAIAKKRYTEDELIALLKEKLAEKKIAVQLKADKNIKSQDLISIMEALGQTGLASVKILTEAKRNTDSLSIVKP